MGFVRAAVRRRAVREDPRRGAGGVGALRGPSHDYGEAGGGTHTAFLPVDHNRSAGASGRATATSRYDFKLPMSPR